MGQAPSGHCEDFVLPNFVLEVPKEIMCHLCNSVLQNPYQTKCGHRFCYSCLDNYIKQKGEGWWNQEALCPRKEDGCKMLSMRDVNPDNHCKRKMESLLVYYPNKEFGCNEEVKWKELKEHEQACLCGVQCPYAKVGCNFKGHESAVETHQLSGTRDHLDMVSRDHKQQANKIAEMQNEINSLGKKLDLFELRLNMLECRVALK